MKSAEDWLRAHASNSLNSARQRRILIQRSVGSGTVVILGIGPQDPAQMRFAENDQMIDALAADRPDQPLSISVLPWRSRRNRLVPDTHGPQPSPDDRAENAVPIADEMARRLVPRESLGDLTCDPLGRGMVRHVGPNQMSAIHANNDEGIEQIEAYGRNNKQIHRGDVGCMIAEKCAPSLTGRPASFDHVFSHRRLRDLEPELQQLAMDARRAP